MPHKGDRITAVHLLVTLKENKGVTMRFMEIFHKMRKRGLKHNNTSISDNLKYLVNQGKIVKHSWHNNSRYGIPATREDGTRYIIVKNKCLPNETIEIEK